MSALQIERHDGSLPMQVWIGRNSPCILTLFSEGCRLTAAEIAGITEFEFIYTPGPGTVQTIKKSACAACFSVAGLAAGQIKIDVGMIAWEPGRDREAKLILSSAVWANGRVIGTLDVEMIDGATGGELMEPLEWATAVANGNYEDIKSITVENGIITAIELNP